MCSDRLCEALQQWHRIKHPGEEPIVGCVRAVGLTFAPPKG